MIPAGYMATILIGFSIYPDEHWLMAVFIATILFGAVFAVLYSRKFVVVTQTTSSVRAKLKFSLSAMFTITALVAIALVIDGGSYLVPVLLAIFAPINIITVAVSRFWTAAAG